MTSTTTMQSTLPPTKTPAEIQADMDALIAPYGQAGASLPPTDMLAEGVYALQSLGRVSPQVLALLKMAAGLLPFFPVIGPMGPMITSLLGYVIKMFESASP